jgi:Skp family chaperone for outer membrane proteins
MIAQEFETAIYAAIAGVAVGGVIKLFNKFIESDKTELATHLALRKELREELDTVKAELHQIQLELDEWKHKYFDQVQTTNELKLEVLSLSEQLNEHKKTMEWQVKNSESDSPLDIP